MTQPIKVSKGLRQGCPLSPLLFMLLVVDMERKLTESDTGFNLTYWDQGVICPCRLPASFYADDIVLLADNTKDLQQLLDICSEEARATGLRFNLTKSACMVVVSQEDHTQYTASRLILQGNPVEWTNTYRYLGVTLSAAPHYALRYEKELRPKAIRQRAFLNTRALWAFNKFEVTRELWKSVAVPALTFANSVLCLSSGTRQSLEIRQKEAGRAALGVHRGVPNEAMQGEVGWSSFEARETVAKLSYERRLS